MMKKLWLMLEKKKFSVWDAGGVVLHLAPWESILSILITVVGNAIVPLSVYITAAFIDSSQAYVSGTGKLSAVLVALILFLLYNIADWVWQAFKRLFNSRIDNKIRSTLIPMLVERRAQLEFQCIEDENTCNLINRIDPYRFRMIFSDLVTFFGFCIKLVGVLVILATNVWWAALVIVVCSVPALYVANQSGKANYRATVSVAQQERKTKYLSDLLSNRDGAAERTLFQSGDYLIDKWEKEYNSILRTTLRTKLKWDLRQKMGSIAIILLTLVIMLCLLFPTVSGQISVGIFISLVSACSQLAFKMQWNFIGQLEKIANSNEFCKDFSSFVQLPYQTAYTKTPVFSNSLESIEFKNVHFRYPGTEKEILRGISFTILPNNHYALVGKNGCGKSTIVKLLLRLYKVDSGEILINGKNINDWDYQELIGLFSVVYQDFAQYQVSVADNLTIGDPNRMEASEDELDALVRQAELVALSQKAHSGLNTQLGKIHEDGIEISGGEWQKIAIGRSIYRPSPISVMDEPTAALSPKAEALLYEKYQLLTKDKTTILISHRLGSTKLADTIFVIDDGIVKESGSREELIEMGGLYCEMFKSQKEWYS